MMLHLALLLPLAVAATPSTDVSDVPPSALQLAPATMSQPTSALTLTSNEQLSCTTCKVAEVGGGLMFLTSYGAAVVEMLELQHQLWTEPGDDLASLILVPMFSAVLLNAVTPVVGPLIVYGAAEMMDVSLTSQQRNLILADAGMQAAGLVMMGLGYRAESSARVKVLPVVAPGQVGASAALQF